MGSGCPGQPLSSLAVRPGADARLASRVLLNAAQPPPGGDNGAGRPFWRRLQVGNPTATRCGPGCHSGSAKYAPSVQHPHGDGRFEGADRVGVRPRGPDFHEGGHRRGTTGAANRCAGPERRRTEISGGTDRPDRRTFRSLKLLVLRAPADSEPSAIPFHSAQSRTVGRSDVAPQDPSGPPHHADLGGLVWATRIPVRGSLLSNVDAIGRLNWPFPTAIGVSYSLRKSNCPVQLQPDARWSYLSAGH